MKFSDLPREMESEILARVPATSLVRVQTTCKRWYVLFKDSKFVEMNLVKGKAEMKVMLKQCDCDFSVSINMHGIHNGFNPYIEFRCNLKSRLSVNKDFIVEICHCNGLLLCNTTFTPQAKMVVWNPCTGQTRLIHSEQTSKRFQKCFLGYENNNKSSHSYKILSFDNFDIYKTEELRVIDQFEIYEFNTDSWRVLDGLTYEGSMKDNNVTLKGDAYCLATNMQKPQVGFILKFDFTRERFERLSLPFQCEHDDGVLSVIKEEKLALLHVEYIDSTVMMRIWVTNTTSDEAKDLSWSNFLVVDLGKFRTFEDIERKLSFLVDEESKMVVYTDLDRSDEDRTRIYVVGEDTYNEVFRGRWNSDIPLLVSYVPSLVQIPARKNVSGGKRKNMIP